MCLVDFALIWSHRCDFHEVEISRSLMSYITVKSILKEFLVPALNLETRWRWSWLINVKKGLLSKASAVLIIWGILPDMLIMRLRAKDCWDQIMRNLHGAVLKCWWVCWGTEVGMPEIVRGWTHNIGRCPPRSPGTWTIPHQGLQSYGYGEFF